MNGNHYWSQEANYSHGLCIVMGGRACQVESRLKAARWRRDGRIRVHLRERYSKGKPGKKAVQTSPVSTRDLG